jgi:hypothetical protein
MELSITPEAGQCIAIVGLDVRFEVFISAVKFWIVVLCPMTPSGFLGCSFHLRKPCPRFYTAGKQVRLHGSITPEHCSLHLCVYARFILDINVSGC